MATAVRSHPGGKRATSPSPRCGGTLDAGVVPLPAPYGPDMAMTFEAAVAQLGHAQAARRRSAARRLMHLGDSRACDALIDNLEREAAIPKAWHGQVLAAQALAACGCGEAVPVLRRLMVGEYWGSAATTEMAEAYVLLGGADLELVLECVGHGRFPLTLGAFRAMARLGLTATDADVAALHQVCVEQQIDLQGSNPHLDLRYPLGQAARRWTGPATDRLFGEMRSSGIPELVMVADAASAGRFGGDTHPTITG